MDAIKRSSSFLHHTKLNILFSNHTSRALNFRPASRPISISAKNRRSSEATENVVVVEKPLKSDRFLVSDGLPSPFGATVRDNGVNFSVYSANSVSATICLISLSYLRQNKVTEEIQLDPSRNRTGHVWHVFVKGSFKDMLYGYRFDGKFSPEDGHYYDSPNILLDPYAKAIISRDEFGILGPDENCWPQMACMVPTLDEEGVAEKLDHLQELGINCVELMPCHEFNELEYYSYNTILGDHRVNFWGVSTIGFFSPMIRYSSASSNNSAGRAINEFKILVKEAHKRGIEVIMDVVLNHTAEGNEKGPIFSFRGVDNSVYYMLAPKGEFYNYSGCGNTFNCNHPVVRQFIVDCLRYWVTEMHVDGFRFDLGSIMSRSSSFWAAANVYGADVEGDLLTTGSPISYPPVIDMISNDPILRGVKLIAEAWDAGGLYQVGMFPHWGIWSEWNGRVSKCIRKINCVSFYCLRYSIPETYAYSGSKRCGKFRDVVRQFIKGTDGFSGTFAECLCGSPNLYQGGRKPWNSINFVCAHDGFTLADLVTYNNKNNLANGEENNDGENHNYSWNCGEEGEFASISVKRIRKRQMRNFFVSLMVSQGVPMIYMGDEYGHTKGGNNNTYCHDNYMNYFRWDKKEEAHSDFFRFCRLLIKFRDECESLGLNDFPTAKRLQWHGLTPGMLDWSEASRFVAFSMVDSVKKEIYVAFNTSHLATDGSHLLTRANRALSTV